MQAISTIITIKAYLGSIHFLKSLHHIQDSVSHFLKARLVVTTTVESNISGRLIETSRWSGGLESWTHGAGSGDGASADLRIGASENLKINKRMTQINKTYFE